VHTWVFRWRQPAAPGADWVAAAAIDVLLFTLFAVHHSVFARLGLRAWVRARFGARYERSLYVWISSVLFAGVYLAWQPVPGRLWQTSGAVAWLLAGIQAVGIFITVRGARRLDVLDLAGVRQGFDLVASSPPTLVSDGLYGFVRHPIYFGWVLMVWAPPVMTGTRLVFAAVSTAYLVLAVPLEERALRERIGAPFIEYTRQVRWRIVPGVY
jgi:protein-S-isoprenylcysteine O-methyltransferase Ste14